MISYLPSLLPWADPSWSLVSFCSSLWSGLPASPTHSTTISFQQISQNGPDPPLLKPVCGIHAQIPTVAHTVMQIRLLPLLWPHSWYLPIDASILVTTSPQRPGLHQPPLCCSPDITDMFPPQSFYICVCLPWGSGLTPSLYSVPPPGLPCPRGLLWPSCIKWQHLHPLTLLYIFP